MSPDKDTLSRRRRKRSYTGTMSAASVFEAHGLTKVYRMGELEVHALRGVDLELVRGRVRVAEAGAGMDIA